MSDTSLTQLPPDAAVDAAGDPVAPCGTDALHPAPTDDVGALAEELVALVRAVLAFKHAGPRVEECDPAAYPLLFPLLGGPRRVGDVASCVKSDVTVASRHGSALVAAGLASKSPDPDDRRAQLLALTDAGRDLVADIRAYRADVFRRALDAWTPQEIADLLHTLRRLRGDLDQTRAEPVAPRPNDPHDLPAKEN